MSILGGSGRKVKLCRIVSDVSGSDGASSSSLRLGEINFPTRSPLRDISDVFVESYPERVSHFDTLMDDVFRGFIECKGF